jgi:hypothetical protein
VAGTRPTPLRPRLSGGLAGLRHRHEPCTPRAHITD